MKNKNVVIFTIIGFTVLAGGALFVKAYTAPAPLDSFASCLKEKGAVFYGAFWCPHCKNQKKMFGKSEKKLPYVECSSSNGKEQVQVCKDKKINGYPTWEFADGTRESGELSFERLSEKTGCTLPDNPTYHPAQ